MAAKTANVTARIQPDIKEQAEIIPEKPEITFDLNISKAPETRDAISEDRFNQIMDNGLQQAKNNESVALDDIMNLK